MNLGTQKPVWANETLRLDPEALPQAGSYRTESSLPRRAGVHDASGAVHFKLDAAGATFKRPLSCGLDLSLAMPTKAYLGVAARAFENQDGSTTVTLELMHRDENLSVPLLVSDRVEAVVGDWQRWCRLTSLPMMVVEVDGELTKLEIEPTALPVRQAQPRRRRHTPLRNKSRFSRRRSFGRMNGLSVLNAQEIIARN
ncbi:MAG: DUF6101 family protein [Pseudomonadota bacterium]